jgi:hypothetical protein
VAAGGAAFLLAGVMVALWAGANTLYTLTDRHNASVILRQALMEPYTTTVQKRLAATKGPEIAYEQDLVSFDLTRSAATNPGNVRLAAEVRATELYEKGLPKDPGLGRTQTVLPRAVLRLLTDFHHRSLATAKTAAGVGAATALLLCAVIATGAARFGLPGAAVLLGRVILTWHIRLADFWIEKPQPGALVYRGKLRVAAAIPIRQVTFAAIALLVAGLVYSALLGGTRVVVSERRKDRKRKRDKSAPAPADASEPVAEAPSEVTS